MLKLLTTGDVAKICQVAPRTIAKWIDAGKLPATRETGTNNRLVTPDDLDRFLIENGMPGLADRPQEEQKPSRRKRTENSPIERGRRPVPGIAAAPAVVPSDSDALRAYVADTLVRSFRYEWRADPGAVAVPKLTAQQVLKNALSHSRGSDLARTAADGILTDGTMALPLPPRVRVPEEIAADARSRADQIREMLKVPVDTFPLEVAGVRVTGTWILYLLYDSVGNYVRVAAEKYDLLTRTIPGGTFHLQKRAYGQEFDDQLPIIVCRESKPIALLMPMDSEQEPGEVPVITPAGQLGMADALFAALELNQDVTSERVVKSKDRTHNKRKQFTICVPGVGALDVKQDNHDDWYVEEDASRISYLGAAPLPGPGDRAMCYGLGLTRRQAHDLAVRVLGYAHGSEGGRLTFKKKG